VTEDAPTVTEVARQQAERAAMAQDAANTARRKAAAHAEHAEVDLDAEDRRRWALHELRQNREAFRIGGEPRLIAWVNPDGSTNLRADPDRPGKTIATTVNTDTPVIVGEARIWTDEEEAAWHRRQREAQNAELAGAYDLAELLSAGIMTEAEAEHPDVRVAAAARAKRAAASGIPYNLANSVR
jgi:hypothetical protein